MKNYKQIGEYFKYLYEKYNLQICIKDFCGFIAINKELDEELRPYLAHMNSFCIYVKRDKDKHKMCLSMIAKISSTCKKINEVFYGVCHAGLGEYVVPIFSGGMLLGSINVGFFQKNQTLAIQRIKEVCAKSTLLLFEDAISLYEQNISSSTAKMEDILPVMKVIAEYLGSTYSFIQLNSTNVKIKENYNSYNEDNIIAHSTEYIRINYHLSIKVIEIANFCHCSESHINHIFKKRTGVNINVFINKVRIEVAKNELLKTDKNITNIAITVGFNDPNYFSKVFTSLLGVPPTEYRRRFKNKN